MDCPVSATLNVLQRQRVLAGAAAGQAAEDHANVQAATAPSVSSSSF